MAVDSQRADGAAGAKPGGIRFKWALVILVGLPMFVSFGIQGVTAARRGIASRARLAQLAEQYPEAAPVIEPLLKRSGARSRVMRNVTVGMLGGAFVFAFFVGRSFARRIDRASLSARRIAKGELDTPVDKSSDVELRRLTQDLEDLRARMRDKVALEVEHAELAKATELSRAVQGLFLPPERSFEAGGLRGATLYEPVSRSGGDWWVHHTAEDGSALFAVGDVTGHGSSAAVVTAAVSSQFEVLLEHYGLDDMTGLLQELNDGLYELCSGRTGMTMVVFVLDPKRTRLTVHNAGGPPFVITSSAGDSTRVVGGASTPLGRVMFRSAHHEVLLRQGDRVFGFTDGIVEAAREDGLEFGMRRLRSALEDAADLPLVLLPEQLQAVATEHMRGAPRADDWTLVALEVA